MSYICGFLIFFNFFFVQKNLLSRVGFLVWHITLSVDDVSNFFLKNTIETFLKTVPKLS